MKKTRLILGIGVLTILGGALIGTLRHKNTKERMTGFDDGLSDGDLFEDGLSGEELKSEEKPLHEIKEDVDKNREEIISLWEHIEAISESMDKNRKDRG